MIYPKKKILCNPPTNKNNIMKTKLHYVFSLVLIFISFSVFGQNSYFTKVKKSGEISKLNLDSYKSPKKFDTYLLDSDGLRYSLVNAPKKGELNSNLIIEFPALDGRMIKFQIFEASVMHPDLQARYPEIRSYVGYGIESSAYLRFSFSPYNGFNGIILNEKNGIVFESDKENLNNVRVYHKSDQAIKSGFECSTIDKIYSIYNDEIEQENRILSADATMHTFDLAMSVTGEYSLYHGGTLLSVNAAINTTVTNVNAIFENDFNVKLELIPGNDAIIYLDGSTDPYDSADTSNYSAELASNLDATLNDNDYDIGHLMGGIGNGGNAGCIGCVCVNGEVATFDHKGSGYTSLPTPVGPAFDVDFVAHEIGHQFGGNHTFTHQSEGPGIAQMEPGSGSTIMGYAGITGATDLQQNSDPYFHAISIQQITDNVSTRSCDIETTIVNNVPVANAGGNLTLPIGTPFKLTGSATDADGGDVLTYCWEQFDENNGTGGGYPDETSTNSDLPLFRSYNPTTSPSRTFPELQSLLDNGVNGNTWEKVPTVTRSADFRLTVRDNKPGGAANDFDDMIVNWDNTYGPFQVTSQNVANTTVWTQLTSETITWDFNNTDVLAGAANVNILLSLDGGLTYTETLASNTPNDGSEIITVPNVEAPYCRIMIEPTANQFFAINTADFAIGNYSYQSTESCTNYTFNAGISVPEDSGSYAGYVLTIPASGILTDVDINVNITHVDNGDLYYGVRGPWETAGVNRLASGICSTFANTDLTFDDEGTAVDCTSTNNGDNVLPLDPLSFADGQDSVGDWIFFITDINVGDGNTATWNSVTLTLCEGSIEPVLATNDLVEVENLFTIFPNPNNGQFMIQLNSTSNNTIKVDVFDLRGRSIYNKFLNSTSGFDQTIDLGNIQSGMYLVNVTDGNRRSVRKILVD